jgi:DNA repair protein RadC
VKLEGVYSRIIHYPLDVVNAARELIGSSAQECFIVFVLDVKNRVLGYYTAALGSIDSCPIDMRDVFRTALMVGGSGVVCCHCHPSGNTTPSEQDRTVTKRIGEVAKMIGIDFIDHLITTEDDYYSLREHQPELFKATQ